VATKQRSSPEAVQKKNMSSGLQSRPALERFRSSTTANTSTHLGRTGARPNPKDIPSERVTFAFAANFAPCLVRDLGTGSDENAQLRINALRAMCDQLNSPVPGGELIRNGCLDVLIQHAVSGEPAVQRLATTALELVARSSNGKLAYVQAGEEKLATLLPLLNDTDTLTRLNFYKTMLTMCGSAQCVNVLVAIGVVKTLVQKSKQEKGEIQKLCLEVLYHTLKSYGETALVEAQDQGATKTSINLLLNDSERVRELALKNVTLLCFSTQAKLEVIEMNAIAKICPLLSDISYAVRAAAAGALMGVTTEKRAKIQVIEAGGLQLLTGLLDDPSRSVQLNALKALSQVVVHPEARKYLNTERTINRVKELINVENNSLLSRAARTFLNLVLWKP
jgi:HEAT repeat protein